jgi:hypothetical protein
MAGWAPTRLRLARQAHKAGQRPRGDALDADALVGVVSSATGGYRPPPPSAPPPSAPPAPGPGSGSRAARSDVGAEALSAIEAVPAGTDGESPTGTTCSPRPPTARVSTPSIRHSRCSSTLTRAALIGRSERRHRPGRRFRTNRRRANPRTAPLRWAAWPITATSEAPGWSPGGGRRRRRTSSGPARPRQLAGSVSPGQWRRRIRRRLQRDACAVSTGGFPLRSSGGRARLAADGGGLENR